MRLFFTLTIVTLSVFFTSCTHSPEKNVEVLVSIPPYLYFIQELTEGELSTISLVPPEANPHLYEPSPKQVALAKSAKVWIRLNESFEYKIAQSLTQQNKKLITLNLAEELILPEVSNEGCCKHHKHHNPENVDLHFWLSLRLAQQQADLIAKTLLKAYPERKKQLEKTLPLLKKKLEETDKIITKELEPFSGDTILVSHAAFGYFCYDYNLKQLAIESEGKDPLPQKISSIIDIAHSTKIQSILTQAQYNNKGAELIAANLHMQTHLVDPYSANYLENLLHIAKAIAEPSK